MSDESEKWISIAKGEMGTHEVSGPKSNPRILEYNKFTLLDATSDEVSWCSSFVNWCMVQAGFKGTKSALARSWLNWGNDLKIAKLGCVTVFKRGNSPWQGHVGFYVGEGAGDTLRILGGNQSDQVCVETFSKKQVLGYRWPDLKNGRL